RGHLLVRRPGVERHLLPGRVTGRRRARLRRRLRGFVRVRIVAGAPFPAVRVLLPIEVREGLLPVVAPQTLRPARGEYSARRVDSRERGDLRRERVTDGTMTDRLVLHLLHHDLRVALLVAPALSAGRLCGLEAVHLDAVAGDALDVLERARVGLE